MKSMKMNNKIPGNILESLIDKAIITEAEQDNIDFGHALKNITTEQLESIFRKKCEISSSMINVLVDCAIKKEAEQDNAEIGYALKNISSAQLNSIIGSNKTKVIPFKRVLRERLIWVASIAAIFIGAIPVGNHIVMIAKNEGIESGKCDMLYAYNISEIPDLSVGTKGEDISNFPNITVLSNDQLESEIPELESLFNEAESSQQVILYGKTLTMAYLKLKDSGKAIEVLNQMKTRLQEDSEDYEDTITWCDNIIIKLK